MSGLSDNNTKYKNISEETTVYSNIRKFPGKTEEKDIYPIYTNGGLSDNINGEGNFEIKKEVAVSTMDENRILEKYMDKIDQDRRDQEERLSNNIKLMENRITEERRLSEERMEKRFNKAMESLEKTNDKIENLESNLTEKIDSTNKWIIGTCLATILGIAALVLTVIVTK